MKLKVVVHEAEECGFWAEVPAVPGCATQGENFEELLQNLYEAVEGCLSVDIEPSQESDHPGLLKSQAAISSESGYRSQGRLTASKCAILNPMEKHELRVLIQTAPDEHPLRSSGDDYRESFIAAFLNVNAQATAAQSKKILKRKFLVAADAVFSLDTYLQGASELSVAHHVKQQPVTDFETDKKVNPTNNKDVDVFCKSKSLACSIEVKCAEELDKGQPNGFRISIAGRMPDHHVRVGELQSVIPNLTLSKNKDNTMKQFLINASQKFNPNVGVEDVNVLFVACGDHHNMNAWYLYLYGPQGLFTREPFYSPDEYGLVDVVIVSNLRYRHEHARSSADWSLKDTLMLPFVNPYKRATASSEGILAGLNMFEHHLGQFVTYVPGPLEIPADILKNLKVIHYVLERLGPEQRARYFPTVESWP